MAKGTSEKKAQPAKKKSVRVSKANPGNSSN